MSDHSEAETLVMLAVFGGVLVVSALVLLLIFGAAR